MADLATKKDDGQLGQKIDSKKGPHSSLMEVLRDGIASRRGARYLAIAAEVEKALDDGRLHVGDRLPPHRDLADYLNLNLSTVSRAYAEMRARGLIDGVVGRGTFIANSRPDAPPSIWERTLDSDFIDLSHNFPRQSKGHASIVAILHEMEASFDVSRLMAHQVDLGLPEHRDAGAKWLERMGVKALPDEVIVTSGGQHGILMAIAALTHPTEPLMVEELTFYGAKSAANILGRRVASVRMDADGIIPSDLERVCVETGAKVLYCMPTLHNPRTITMPLARRMEVAEVCRRNDIAIIEDDAYSFLLDEVHPPLCSLAPERTTYISTLSKCVGPGLRIGFVRAPRECLLPLGLALRASTLMATPITAEIARRLIDGGTIQEVIDDRRLEAKVRQAIAFNLLPDALTSGHPNGFHIWLQLTNGWHAEEFSREAKLRGVGVAPASLFVVGDNVRANAVRLCTSAAADQDVLKVAFGILSRQLSEHPPISLPSI